jgi:hypothetical protein
MSLLSSCAMALVMSLPLFFGCANTRTIVFRAFKWMNQSRKPPRFAQPRCAGDRCAYIRALEELVLNLAVLLVCDEGSDGFAVRRGLGIPCILE